MALRLVYSFFAVFLYQYASVQVSLIPSGHLQA